MTTEINIVSAVDELCAHSAMNATLLLKLRTVSRDNLAERKVLQMRLGGLEGENLPPEEKKLREAAFAWVLSRFDVASTAVKGVSSPLGTLIRGEMALDCGELGEAIRLLKEAIGQLPGEVKVEVELGEALRRNGQFEEAAALASRLEAQGVADADLMLLKGRCLEEQGQPVQACTYYRRALELNANHASAAFRLGYHLDLRGEDDKALELYRRVTGHGPAFVNAMVNMALLLEDREDVDGAIHCLKEALKVDPANRRAALFLKDAIGSLDMYYDEAERKENERLEAILRIPVSDFELSVRSRNCLTKMNVRTLGDLVRKTEQELLSYKNFGETSLHEIRNLLESKGLRLGMFKEEDAKRARAARLRAGSVENAILLKSISDLDFTVRSRKCMQALNVETVGDLIEKTEAELLSSKNFGQTSLNEIKAKLTELGLTLKPAH